VRRSDGQGLIAPRAVRRGRFEVRREWSPRPPDGERRGHSRRRRALVCSAPMRTLSPDDPTLALFSVLREDGSADPSKDPFLPKETLLAMYRQLLRIRRIDERMLGKQRQGKVGFYGPITGQEATPIATAFALKEG